MLCALLKYLVPISDDSSNYGARIFSKLPGQSQCPHAVVGHSNGAISCDIFLCFHWFPLTIVVHRYEIVIFCFQKLRKTLLKKPVINPLVGFKFLDHVQNQERCWQACPGQFLQRFEVILKQKVFKDINSKIKSPSERNLKGYSIAKLYYGVRIEISYQD